jgi:hypothetical protein
MQNVGRRLAFVLASSNHGTTIVNRFDYRMVDEKRGYGVGFQILENACFDPRRSETRGRPARLAQEAFWRRCGGDRLRRGYQVIEAGINVVAIHASDPTLADIAPQKQPSPVRVTLQYRQ